MSKRNAILALAGLALVWGAAARGDEAGSSVLVEAGAVASALNAELGGRLLASADGVATEGDWTLAGRDKDAQLAALLEVRGRAEARATAGGAGAFEAADESDDGAYTVGEDWAGKNGGEGFGAWRAGSGSAAPAVRTVAVDGGFYMQAGETAGEMAMVRDLKAGAGLVSGEFSLTVWGAAGGADEPGDFAGFAVYGANGELFRWGFRLMEGDEPFDSFSCSLDGGNTYSVISEGYPGGGVEYLLTWEQLGGKTRFTLSAAGEGGSGSYFSGYTVSLGTAERVTAIAAVLTESGFYAAGGDGSAMTFDHLRVTGTRGGAVPEPGVLGLLAVGCAGLAGRGRGKK